ncbi:hypothetical protein PUR29_37080 [Methylobacterium ajmalii]|uniref:Uncharacterized protein n=1 Tax=Methylobacterium ajmalii TaxID=2738439 RepID=A0ABV0A7E6_9HYPH
MVDIIHGVVRQAIDAGELEDETPGFKIDLHLDMDAKEHGPFVRVTTPNGEFPLMKREDAQKIGRFLSETEPGGEAFQSQVNDRKMWSVGFVGTAVEIIGRSFNTPIEDATRVVMSVPLARDFARQLLAVAQKAAHA